MTTTPEVATIELQRWAQPRTVIVREAWANKLTRTIHLSLDCYQLRRANVWSVVSIEPATAVALVQERKRWICLSCVNTQNKQPVTSNRGHCPKCPDEEHTCPYAEEINDDSEFLCTCCPDCTQECANDI